MYTAIALGAIGYLAIGSLLLVRSWQSARRRVFPPGSPLEPVVIVLWPLLPSLWWRRPKPRDRTRPPAADGRPQPVAQSNSVADPGPTRGAS